LWGTNSERQFGRIDNMAFASAITKTGVMGAYKVAWGTYTNGSGDTGGNVNTGLTNVHVMLLQPGGASAIATAATVNETLPAAGNAITIVTADNEDGQWFAIGK